MKIHGRLTVLALLSAFAACSRNDSAPPSRDLKITSTSESESVYDSRSTLSITDTSASLRLASAKLRQENQQLGLDSADDPAQMLAMSADKLDLAASKMSLQVTNIKKEELEFQKFENKTTPDKIKLEEVETKFDSFSTTMTAASIKIARQLGLEASFKEKLTKNSSALGKSSSSIQAQREQMTLDSDSLTEAHRQLKEAVIVNLDQREKSLNELNGEVSNFVDGYNSFSDSQSKFSSDVVALRDSAVKLEDLNVDLTTTQASLNADVTQLKNLIEEYKTGIIPRMTESMEEFITSVQDFQGANTRVSESYGSHRTLLDDLKRGPVATILNEVSRLKGVDAILTQLISKSEFENIKASLLEVQGVVKSAYESLGQAVIDISENIAAQEKLSVSVQKIITNQKSFLSQQERLHAIQQESLTLLESLVADQSTVLDAQSKTLAETNTLILSQKNILSNQLKMIATFEAIRRDRQSFASSIAATIQTTREFILAERLNIARLRKISDTVTPNPTEVLIANPIDLTKLLVNGTLQPGKYSLSKDLDLGGKTLVLNIARSTFDGKGFAIKNAVFVTNGPVFDSSIIKNLTFENVTFMSAYGIHAIKSELENIVIRGIAIIPYCAPEALCPFRWSNDFVPLKLIESKAKSIGIYLHVDSMGLTALRAQGSEVTNLYGFISSSHRLAKSPDPTTTATALHLEASKISNVNLNFNLPLITYLIPFWDNDGYINNRSYEEGLVNATKGVHTYTCTPRSPADLALAGARVMSSVDSVTMKLESPRTSYDYKDYCTFSNGLFLPTNMPGSITKTRLFGNFVKGHCNLGAYSTNSRDCFTTFASYIRGQVPDGYFYTALLTHPDTPKPTLMLVSNMEAQGLELARYFGFNKAPENLNWGGLKDKWFKDANGVSYFIIPTNMGIYKFNGGTKTDFFSKSNFVGYAAPAQYNNLALLFISSPLTAPAKLIAQLKLTPGFVNTQESLNFEGMQEKWFKDSAGNRLYMLPTGSIYRWDGSHSAPTTTSARFPGTSAQSYMLTPANYRNLQTIYSLGTTTVIPKPLRPGAAAKISRFNIAFAWTDTGKPPYEIYISDVNNESQSGGVSGLFTNTHLTEGLNPGRKYRWWVRGADSNWSSPAEFETISTEIAPKNTCAGFSHGGGCYYGFGFGMETPSVLGQSCDNMCASHGGSDNVPLSCAKCTPILNTLYHGPSLLQGCLDRPAENNPAEYYGSGELFNQNTVHVAGACSIYYLDAGKGGFIRRPFVSAAPKYGVKFHDSDASSFNTNAGYVCRCKK